MSSIKVSKTNIPGQNPSLILRNYKSDSWRNQRLSFFELEYSPYNIRSPGLINGWTKCQAYKALAIKAGLGELQNTEILEELLERVYWEQNQRQCFKNSAFKYKLLPYFNGWEHQEINYWNATKRMDTKDNFESLTYFRVWVMDRAKWRKVWEA